MKVAFFGTSDFGLPSLKLLAQHFNITAVYTAPEKKRSRNKVTKTDIHTLAESLDLNVFTAEDLSDVQIDADIGVVISYGLMIPKSLTSQAKYGFINLHPSDLPLFRGAAPIERTIESGVEHTAVCVIQITPKLDAGDIMARHEYRILETDDSNVLHDKFSHIGASMIIDVINNIDSITPLPQTGNPTYAKKILKEELILTAGLTVKQITSKIRAFTTRGCARMMHNGTVIKIVQASASETQLTALDIKCLDGFVSPTIITPEGKKQMNASDFLRQP